MGKPPWTGQVDGVITSAARVPKIVPWMQSGGVPVVNANADLEGTRIVSVYTDVRSIARLATEHFCEVGLRNFAYVGYRKSDGSHTRRDAFAGALAERGFSLKSYETEHRFGGTYEDYGSSRK
jgi:DNA-binding LacI/PurR family transcriptional regulator